MGPRAGLDTVLKRNIPSSCPDSNLQRYTTELCRVLDQNSRFLTPTEKNKSLWNWGCHFKIIKQPECNDNDKERLSSQLTAHNEF